MCGHDPKSPEVRAWSVDVDAGLPVRLMPGVVVVGALVLDAKHPKPILAVQEVIEPPVEEVVSSVPKAVGGNPTPRGIGMVSPTLELIATIVGIITPVITGIPAYSRLGCPLCGWFSLLGLFQGLFLGRHLLRWFPNRKASPIIHVLAVAELKVRGLTREGELYRVVAVVADGALTANQQLTGHLLSRKPSKGQGMLKIDEYI